MTVKRAIVVLLIFSLLFTAPAVYATGCHKFESAVKHAVKQVEYLLPAYSGHYGQQQSQRRQVNQADVLLAILEELRAINRKLDGQSVSGGDFAAVVANRCARCHDAASAQRKGGGLKLLDEVGELIQLSLFEKRSILRAIEHQNSDPRLNMPPGGKLTDSELAIAREFLR